MSKPPYINCRPTHDWWEPAEPNPQHEEWTQHELRRYRSIAIENAAKLIAKRVAETEWGTCITWTSRPDLQQREFRKAATNRIDRLREERNDMSPHQEIQFYREIIAQQVMEQDE